MLLKGSSSITMEVLSDLEDAALVKLLGMLLPLLDME